MSYKKLNILLVGEFSGYHYNLKEGLEFLGHEVVFISSGDGFKKIKSDIQFSKYGNNIFDKILNAIRNVLIVRKLKEFDVVQFVNPYIFDRYINSYLIKYLIEKNKKSFLLNAGTDAFFFLDIKKKFKYSPHEDFEKYDIKGKNYFKEEKFLDWNKYLVEKVNGVIPIMYEYIIESKNVRKVIPIPINIEKFNFNIKQNSKNKIKIFHGLNSKPGFKGTRHIVKALDKIKREFKNDVEVIMDGNIPFNEYLELLKTIDINIDQCNSYSYGVNAVLSLSMGIVTLSGCEKECLEAFGIKDSPIINILPDPDDIYKKIKLLIKDRKKLEELGIMSRQYCEKIHSHKKIASKFIKEWSKLG